MLDMVDSLLIIVFVMVHTEWLVRVHKSDVIGTDGILMECDGILLVDNNG